MKFAYADPPYLGCCGLYDHHHPDGLCWDKSSTHRKLIRRLWDEFGDGWAVSLSAPSLEEYAHIVRSVCDSDMVRFAAWVKPFASFKPNVNPAFAWEPVVWFGGRRPRGRNEPTVRDWVAAPITLKRGLTGVKPDAFCFWLFDLLGLTEADDFVDLFPGSGAVSRALDSWRRQRRFA